MYSPNLATASTVREISAAFGRLPERGSESEAGRRPEPLPPSRDGPYFVAGRALIALREIFKMHGRLARLEGDHLELILRTRSYRWLGFASFRDFAREALQTSHRTARRRVALSRLLNESAELAVALEEGRVSPCQALALSPLRDAPDLPFWIEMADSCTVRDLERCVADYLSDVRAEAGGALATSDLEGNGEVGAEQGDEPGRRVAANEIAAAAGETEKPGRRILLAPEETEEPGRRVAFAAPISASIIWENGMEMARRILGWDAPVYRCVEVVLAEAAGELPDVDEAREIAPVPEAQFDRGLEPPFCVESRRDGLAPARLVNTPQLAVLRETVSVVEQDLQAMASEAGTLRGDRDHQETGEDQGHWSLNESMAFLSNLKRKDRALRLLLARLLRDADAANVLGFLGYRNISEFLVSGLKMSERTAARLRSQSWAFEDNPKLAEAFASGRIGLGQAYLVNRVAVTSTQDAFIRRAESVTHLQFEREIRFLERLAEYLPSVARNFRRPLPCDGLEDALKDRLRDLGWSEAAIQERLGTYDACDPAVDPVLMRRLEALLELVALGQADQDLARSHVPTLATPEAGGTLRVGEVLPMLATLPGAIGDSETLDTGTRWTTISFWAPEPLIADWESALARVQGQHGNLPPWGAALFVLRCAVREWERIDPARRPREWKILERDEWRCQAPGCSSRRRLEVHHIIFRSHGGPDDPENLTTLCHGHHRHGVHDGYLRAGGTAPGGLRWELGDAKSRSGMVFRGSRRIH
jgi:HNH endonuclease